MQSNILLFLLFSVLSAIILYFIPSKQKKYALLIFNLLFYLLCDYKFILLIIISIIWSYYIGKKIACQSSNRKYYLFLGIIPIIVILCFFKYYNFFIPSQNDVLKIIMPLGISYYTFKIISYLADIYMEKRDNEGSLIDYAVYVSFFPQIICGPIMRSQGIMEKVSNLSSPTSYLISAGVSHILSGLFKKLVIADRLDTYVNTIFSNPSGYPALALWMAAFFYTIQIYCDFAGYSEIAIGVTNLLGIECTPNFNLPYFSYNIRDFWRRWHISLSSWLRDYIYIPLGGNRKGKNAKIINTILTFLVSGLWHGNGLNYLIWGLYHGIFSLVNYKRATGSLRLILQIVSTFFVVMFGWVFFKATTLSDACVFISSMFWGLEINMDSIVASVLPFTGDFSCLAYLLCICLFILILFVFEYREYVGKDINCEKERNIRLIIYFSSIILFGVVGQNSFLYANF